MLSDAVAGTYVSSSHANSKASLLRLYRDPARTTDLRASLRGLAPESLSPGKGVWIFPHQNNADFVMNSAAEYEAPEP